MSTRVLGVFGTPQDTTALVQHEGRTIRVPVPPALRAAVEQSTGGALPPTLAEQLLAGGDLGPRTVTYDDNTGSAFDSRTGAFPAVASGVGAVATRALTPSEGLMGGAGFDYTSLIQSESGGNWQAQNDVPGSGGPGHFGRLQFSRGRLADAARAGIIPEGVSPERFMADPEMQQRVEAWHFSDIDRFIDRNELGQFEGQTINGVPVTRQGMHAVAHLGGSEGLRRFLQSSGRYNPADAYGTTLLSYLGRHEGGAPTALSASSMGGTQRPFPPRFEDVQNDPQASPTQPRFEALDPEAAIRARLAAGAPAPEATQAALGEASQTFGERLMAGFEDLPEAFQYLQLMDNSSTMRVPAPPPINRGRQNTGAQALQRMGIRGLA